MRKASLRAVLWGAMLFGAALSCQAQEVVSIARATVNMRASPGMDSAVRWELSRHYPLKVLQRQGSWLKVRDFEGDVGWVATRLTSRMPMLIVKADRANIRSGPGTRYRIMAQAKYGDLLKTKERRGRWVNVTLPHNRKSGWVARALVWGW